MHSSPTLESSTTNPNAYWRALLHRWFVQYNPFYLVSAMLVLAGLNLVSRGLAHQGSLYGPLLVAGLAELYAVSLIGGAALLVRNGQTRSAVILAVLAVGYQADLTLHTETCALLGVPGFAAALLWLGLFVGKLAALGWAFRARIGQRALLTATLGAASLVTAPYVLPHVAEGVRGSLLAMLVVGLYTFFPRAIDDHVATREPLDAWGQLVLRRALWVVWTLWALMLGVHVTFWAGIASIDFMPLAFAVVFLVAARNFQERRLWIVLGATTAVVAFVIPSQLAAATAFAAIALLVRAASPLAGVVSTTSAAKPYRTAQFIGEDVVASHVALAITAAERLRLLSGAVAAGYVAAWTLGWHGGAAPAHSLVVDVVGLLAVAGLVWRLRARLVLALPVLMGVQALASAHLIPTPRSTLEWGGAVLGLGFVLLFGSLAVSRRVQSALPKEPGLA